MKNEKYEKYEKYEKEYETIDNGFKDKMQIIPSNVKLNIFLSLATPEQIKDLYDIGDEKTNIKIKKHLKKKRIIIKGIQ